MRVLPRLLVSSIILGVASGTALPQAGPPAGTPGPDDTWKLPDRDNMNANTVTVITAPAGGATSIFGSDIARVLDDGKIRVLPVLGKGPVRNVVDILYLKAIDMGMVVADVPEFYRLQYKIPNITSQLRYIAKLYNNEIHVVAPTSIKSIFDLAGKRIVASTDVGYYAAKVIFSRLNMNVTYDYWTDDRRRRSRCLCRQHRQGFWAPASRQERGSQVTSGADPVRSAASGHVFAHHPVERRLSEHAGAGGDHRHACDKRPAGELQLAGELRALSQDGELRKRLFLKVG
jgi:hypothetical protein